jgi:uracil DNA glycosylase
MRAQIFAALNLTPLKDVRVVIIGQDPYFNDNQAHGLCFSVKKGVKVSVRMMRANVQSRAKCRHRRRCCASTKCWRGCSSTLCPSTAS